MPSTIPPNRHPDDRGRLIVAIDLDAFYLSVERLLNPALNGLPVGVVQKHILATASYEARAVGVGKLMLVKRALELCPRLVLVNGEDLSRYREFSKRVRDLVNSFLEPDQGVEKLGLDEVFLDITKTVHSHLAAPTRPDEAIPAHSLTPTYKISKAGRTYFTLQPALNDQTGEVEPRGFWYDNNTFAGHVLPRLSDSEASGNPARLQALQVGSHVCAFIRQEIRRVIGLTTSAGLGYSKQIAKLVGTTNKPNDQTTFLDVQSSAAAQEYLDPLDLRRLNGFGSKICATIENELASAGAQVTPATTAGEPSEELFTSCITVHHARSSLSQEDFVRLFGRRLGGRLWGLLHGIDDEPVNPTPPFPKQISVEDSYASNPRRRLSLIAEQMEELLVDLLTRLEEELLVPTSIQGPSTTWQRYPTRLSLALRRAWDIPHGRESKSIPFPRFLFDTMSSREARAAKFQRTAGHALLRDVLGVSRSCKEVSVSQVFDVYVINVSAQNMSTSPPPPSIHDAWLQAQERSRLRGVEIDWDVLNALPDDLRQETMKAYGLTSPAAPPVKAPVDDIVGDFHDNAAGSFNGIVDLNEDDSDVEEDVATCRICGLQVYPFAVVAHGRWHALQES